uniref:Splicing factor 3A subunit 1 n=1 Tax=Peronospora matthiolae TaxID=2874970 RepID=A0AAV1THM5_9STRA
MAASEPLEEQPPAPHATVQGRVTGIIYPPLDIRAVVDKTAQFVANNGRAFESRIVGERMSTKFSFLRESDPYHAYYEHKVSELIAKKKEAVGEPQQEEVAAHAEEQTPRDVNATVQEAPNNVLQAASSEVVVEKKAVQNVAAQVAKKINETELEPPPEEKFIIKHPALSALDQEIMYLTAQYTALSGSSFLSGLATREQRNPQFDFLKPTHPLFAYFTALVESYTLVLAKQEEQIKRIEEGVERMQVLDRCVHRMEWQRTERERKDKEAAESDAERRALAQIDWHDFVVVETITFDDNDNLGASAARDEGEGKASDDEDMDMEEEEVDDDDDESNPDIKVVENYIPQATAATAQQPLLSVDGKTLSSAEANEHMRILLMNPKWREETQRHLEKQKESSYAVGSAIADSLRRFATKRADIFASSAEEEARLLQATTAPTAAEQQQRQQQEHLEEMDSDKEEKSDSDFGTPGNQQMPEHAGRTEQELVSASVPNLEPGGHMVPASVTGAPGMTAPATGHPGTTIPVVGIPGMMPPPVMVPGTLSVGPPRMMPPGMGVPGLAPLGSAPGNFIPPHMRAPNVGPPGVVHGPPGVGAGPPGVLAASGPPGEDLEPATKRQRTGGSSLLPEKEFASRHPGIVRLIVKVPNDPDNAHWKLEGQTLAIELDVKDSMRTLKEKLTTELQGMPVNKQQLKFSMGFVKDALSCAHYNFVNDTELELSVRQRGGRR